MTGPSRFSMESVSAKAASIGGGQNIQDIWILSRCAKKDRTLNPAEEWFLLKLFTIYHYFTITSMARIYISILTSKAICVTSFI